MLSLSIYSGSALLASKPGTLSLVLGSSDKKNNMKVEKDYDKKR
jgi:hypothetical protein